MTLQGKFRTHFNARQDTFLITNSLTRTFTKTSGDSAGSAGDGDVGLSSCVVDPAGLATH